MHAGNIVERGDDRGRGDQCAGADLADTEHPGERRTYLPVTNVGTHLPHPRLGSVADCPLRIQRGTGHQLLRGQLALALV